jgi:hypothetical protein
MRWSERHVHVDNQWIQALTRMGRARTSRVWQDRWFSMFDVRHLGLLLGVAAAPSFFACGESKFVCLADEQCSHDAGAGVCQPNGFCSFPDETCASGQRYGEHAGRGLAGSCVSQTDDGDDDAAGSTTSATSGISETSSASATSGEVTSAADSGETSSTVTSSTSTGGSDDGHASDTTTSMQTTGLEATDDDTNTTGSPVPCFFEADFEDGEIPNGWGVGGDLDVVVSDGMLGMQLVSSPVGMYGWTWSGVLDFTGRELVAEIGSPPPTSGNAQLLLEVTTPTLSYFVVVEGPHLMARTSTGGPSYTTHATVAYDPNDARFVQLSDIGDEMRFSYSDGVTWTKLVDVPIPDDSDLTAANVSFVGGTWQLEAEVGFIGIEWLSICP